MIGLGCGARSYTAALHYSFDYAVDMREIRSIIDGFTATGDFSRAEVGRYVDAAEARRRHLLQSLLQAAGLPLADYRARFGTDPARTSPPSWSGSRTGAGWTHRRRRGSCGSPRWGWPTRTRWVRRCSPRGAGRDGRVRAEVSGPWT